MPAKNDKSGQLSIVEREIENKIYVVRSERVMLDSDLAEVYQVETRTLNQAVKRNLNRFPKDFVFQLTGPEFNSLKSQSVTSKTGRGGRRKLPYVFTEHGAVMLASVLKSQTAVEASIVVVRAFVKMRSILALHQDLADRINELEKVTDHHDKRFGALTQLLADIMCDPKYLKRKIGFVEAKKPKT